MVRPIPPFLLCLLVACSQTAERSSEELDRNRQATPSAKPQPPITAKKIGDVWVFVGEPREKRADIKVISNDALQGGVARVEKGCLTVDGEVVVFWPHQTGLAEEIVEAARETTPRKVSVPGGGGLVSAPEAVVAHCEVASVRFAGRGAP